MLTTTTNTIDLKVGAGGNVRVYDGTAANAISFYPSSVPYIQWANDANAVLSRSASGRLVSTGRLAGGDGIATKTVAETVSDGSFTLSAESGLIALDTTKERLYVRVGSTWRYTSLMGDSAVLGPWTWANLAASTTAEGDYGGHTATARIVSPFNGDVVGITVRGSAVCTAGSATFRPFFNGAVQTLSAVINATDATWDYATQDAGEDTFTAGTGLSVEVTTTSGFLPTGSTEYFAVLYILFRR